MACHSAAPRQPFERWQQHLGEEKYYSGIKLTLALTHPLPVTLLGYAAASLTSLSFFPQACKTARSGDTRALSLPMCLLRTSALAIWLLYGAFSQSGPIIVANGLALMPMALVLERKLRNRRCEALDPIPKH